MPSPPSADSAFLNQIAWRIAAGIAAAAALVAVILTNTHQSAQAAQISSASLRSVPQTGPPPVATPISAPPAVGGDTERGIDFCAQHVTSERSFVVFSKGTCVIIDEPSTQPVIDAIRILTDCADPEARFITREIENGHFLVTYPRAVFHCVFAEEISAHRDEIETSFLRFLTPAERESMPAKFDPPFHAKLGLVARTRLNHDARDPVVTKVIRAKPIDLEENPFEEIGPPEQADPLTTPHIVPPFLPGM